jgi:hypothetical protein
MDFPDNCIFEKGDDPAKVNQNANLTRGSETAAFTVMSIQIGRSRRSVSAYQATKGDGLAYRSPIVLLGNILYHSGMVRELSNRAQRANLMKWRLSELDMWMLRIRCGQCGHDRELKISKFLNQCGGDASLGWLVSRLRCSVPGCHSKPSQVVIKSKRQCVVLQGLLQ